MYPQNATELAAIVAAAVPLLVWAVSGAFSVYTRLGENRRADWLRINELIQILYRGGDHGLWAQMLAVTELRSFGAQRRTLKPILAAAAIFFRNVVTDSSKSLADHIEQTFDVSSDVVQTSSTKRP